MRSSSSLEITGNLSEHTPAELMIEILQSRMEGSLRLVQQNLKIIFYFRSGELVFAVSNQRQHRLFEMLLRADVITKSQLLEIPEFTNDFLLAKALEEKAILPANALRAIFIRQIESILRETFPWEEGTWSFSPLARIKDEIRYQTDVYSLMIEFARNLPKEAIIKRFKSFNESFGKHPHAPAHISLRPGEAFLHSRFEHSFVKVSELQSLSGMSDAETLKNLYCLWLGGFLFRQNWNAAFSEKYIADVLSLKLELKKQPPPKVATDDATAKSPLQRVGKVDLAEKTPENSEDKSKKEELTLEKYLEQVENAETHYQILNVPVNADASEIKRAYFRLAKNFHPDLFHRKTDARTHQRIQHAFTELAHAYEVLRNKESREVYDFKLRKVLEELEKTGKLNVSENSQKAKKELTEASEVFEHGFNLLMEEDYEAALPFLSRAVLLAPEVARYHAYFGKALAMDKSQKFKAEQEIQTAIKIEPENPDFRIMLAEFFIQYKLFKRAEGELKRLLAIAPHNKEAKALLDSLKRSG
jgi:curved DNA-binding protein CbpA